MDRECEACGLPHAIETATGWFCDGGACVRLNLEELEVDPGDFVNCAITEVIDDQTVKVLRLPEKDSIEDVKLANVKYLLIEEDRDQEKAWRLEYLRYLVEMVDAETMKRHPGIGTVARISQLKKEGGEYIANLEIGVNAEFDNEGRLLESPELMVISLETLLETYVFVMGSIEFGQEGFAARPGGSHWIQGAIKHPGSFTRTAKRMLGKKAGSKLSIAKAQRIIAMEKRKHPGVDTLTEKRARLYETLVRLHHHHTEHHAAVVKSKGKIPRGKGMPALK